MEHLHQTMTATAHTLRHDHLDGEHAHAHEHDGEVFHWVQAVVEEEAIDEEEEAQ